MDFLKLGSLGPIVELLQSTLKKLGFYEGYIDGIFGSRTESAVRTFQSEFGLNVDGFVGEKTWDALSPYFNGYTTYTIRSGDTLYKLASRFQTSVNRILFHNPNIVPNRLRVGQEITIPFGSIVPTDISYSYDILQMNLRALTTIYPFLEISSIGKSVLGNDLSFVRFGRGRNEVFYNASFHANEWITSVLLMKFLEDICKAYVDNTSVLGYSIRNLFENTSIYLVPMVNPDGVNLVTGAYPVDSEVYQQALQISNNYPSVPFPRGWKANIQGVDLNLQFPAGWENAREIKFSQGFTSPAPRDFVGFAPLSAPESFAVYRFTLEHNFRLILAYHTQGKEIYWQFQNYAPPESFPIAEAFSQVSNYAVGDVPFNSSFAGYKDWFLQTYSRPGFTIEAGIGTNPLPISQFPQIYRDNLGILLLGATIFS